MTLEALRTQAALKLAPWLKPKGREWTISGDCAPFGSADEIDSTASVLLAEARRNLRRHSEEAAAHHREAVRRQS